MKKLSLLLAAMLLSFAGTVFSEPPAPVTSTAPATNIAPAATPVPATSTVPVTSQPAALAPAAITTATTPVTAQAAAPAAVTAAVQQSKLPSAPPTEAQLSYLQGEVEVLAFGKQSWEKPLLFRKLAQGDSIRTGKSGRAELSFEDGSKVTLRENTSIDLAKLKDKELKGDTLIKLWSGKLRTKFKSTQLNSGLQIQTKHIIAAVKGTDFITDSDETDSKITVFEGLVSMEDPLTKKEIFIKANEIASFLGAIMGQALQMSEEDKKKIQNDWDGTPEAEAKPAAQAPATETPKVEPAKGPEAGGNFGGTFGAVSVNGKTYYMMSMLYEFTLGKFGAGFDLRLLWNDDGIKQDDWDNWQHSLENMFRYVRYGQRGDDLYIKLGVISESTLGHGFIVRRYCNVGIDIYTRKFGSEFDLNFGPFGFESVTNNVAWERFYAGRVFLNIIPGFLQAGVTGAYDAEPAKDKFVSAGGVVTPMPSVSPITVYGADIGLSLLKSDLLSALLYADYGKIKDHGEGIAAPGIAGKLAIFDYRMEYRVMDTDFIAGLFDYIYEEKRPVNWSDPLLAPGGAKKKGVFGALSTNLFGLVNVLGAYEKYDGYLPYIRGEARYKGSLIPKISEVAIGFEQKEVTVLSLKDPNMVAYAQAGVDFAPGVVLLVTMKQTYDVNLDKFKRSTIMAMQMKF
ncbi:MAG: FecR family protein [Candidatus Firestonebacteria bacterium]